MLSVPFHFIKSVLKGIIAYIKASTFENEHEYMLYGPFVNTIKWYNLIGWVLMLTFAVYLTFKVIGLSMVIVNQKTAAQTLLELHQKDIARNTELNAKLETCRLEMTILTLAFKEK